jgi:type I restriction enzyme M protein
MNHAMTIDQILSSAAAATLAPDLATPAAVAAVNAALSKNATGKPIVRCRVRAKDVPAKPEEIIRQLWLHRLEKHYRYPLSRIAIEYPITFGRDTSKRADIVILDADRVDVPLLIVEVKAQKQKDGKEQLKSYTHATGAPLALWSNGTSEIIWHRKNPNYFVEISDLPSASQTIEDIVNQPWTVQDLVDKEKQREVEGIKARSLRQIIEDLEDEVLANAGVDVFEEVFKLIFTKLYDELACHRRWKNTKHLRFRNQNTAAQLKTSIQDLFDEARKKWPGIFPDGEKIKLTPDHLQVCIGSLEEYKFFNSNLDIIDDAFEFLVNKSSKGEKGQYFTPRWVIDMCVKMLNPKEHETLIDTACGSAGFPVHAIFHVWKQILEDENITASNLFTMDEKPPRCEEYVREKVFGLDFDEKSIRVARTLNLIAGDGETNVLHINSLDWKKWDATTKEQEWLDTYFTGWKSLRKYQANKNDNREFLFDILLANPPFAGDIKQTDMLSPYDLAHKVNKDGSLGRLETAVGRDLLFIERNLDFLRPGGRMAIVLPQGRFNNSSDKRLRKYIAERCRILAVVGLHPNTFKPHTGTKTSVLFVQKWNDDKSAGPLCPKATDYNIFFATQRKESKDTRGDKIIATGKDGKLLRDTHGHWIIQHDLFNHEGLTEDGIAEAFEEFAKKERLSFF